jgi:hypothetical protein
MSEHAEFTTSQYAGFVASLWTQIRAALCVGLLSEEESRPSEESAARDGLSSTRGSVRSMDDYAGYHTSNGLGSLDVGGGRSRWGE